MDGPFPEDWPFERKLRVEHVWDAFTLQCLLNSCERTGSTLELPHTGAQQSRFNVAVRQRNDFIQRTGQPELSHRCNKCVRYWKDERTGQITGKRVYDTFLSNTHRSCATGKTSCVVVDGVTVGHPCCAVHNCHTPLASQRDRFCPDHHHMLSVCAIVDCSRPIADGRRVCADPEHQAVEALYSLRGQSRFQLQERLQRARRAGAAAGANEASAALPADMEDWVEGQEEEFTLHQSLVHGQARAFS